MYEWLSQEIKTINTPRFHLIHLPSLLREEKVVEKDLLPPSYLAYISQFGRSKLYRSGNSYIIEILDAPYIQSKLDGDLYVRLGTTAFATMVCFRMGQLVGGAEASIFEIEYIDGAYEVGQTYPTFEAWLVDNCNVVKANMGEGEWIKILNGPPPFTQLEQQIVRERRNFTFSLVGFSITGQAKILVHNQSQMVLPYLSVGVKWKGTHYPIHTIWLPVQGLEPGDSRIIVHDVYKQFIPKEGIELFDLPDPKPEDRDVYWEFKYSQRTKD